MRTLLAIILGLGFPSVAEAQWQFEKRVDEMTDDVTYFALNRGQGEGILIVNCENVFLLTDYSIIRSASELMIRFGTEKAEEYPMAFSLNGSAKFIVVGEHGNEFPAYRNKFWKKARTDAPIRLRVTTSDLRTMTAKFSGSGGKAALDELETVCSSQH